MEEELHANRDAIRRLVRSLTKPGFDSGMIYTNGFVNFETPALNEIRTASRWLSAVALTHLRNGEMEEAFATVLSQLGLLKALETELLVISQLVRFSVAEHAFGILWQVLQTEPVSGEALDRIQMQWQSLEFVRDLIASFEVPSVSSSFS